jgi:hypothetical protein
VIFHPLLERAGLLFPVWPVSGQDGVIVAFGAGRKGVGQEAMDNPFGGKALLVSLLLQGSFQLAGQFKGQRYGLSPFKAFSSSVKDIGRLSRASTLHCRLSRKPGARNWPQARVKGASAM